MKDDTDSAVPTETRRLAAIMFTDIVGFSRQMGSNEARTLRLLETHNRIIQQAVAAHHGAVIKTVGDAFLVDFPSVVNAVQGAQQIQAQFHTHNADATPPEQIHVRIGIHLGDIVQKDGDVFGEGVNIASRLQGLAEPDSICISDMVYRDVVKKLDLGAVASLGQPKLKNIDQRFPVYLLVPEHGDSVRQTLQIGGLQFIRRRGVVPWMAGVLLLIAGAVIAARSLFLPPSGTQPSAPSIQAVPAALPLPDKPSIVVLPFINMSDDPKQDYFSDGITEDLTSDLSKISNLFVIARNSAFTYKGKAVKIQDVGREMGVRYVLEGSVRKTAEQVRVTAQLIDATTGGHLWSERYDRPLTDIFAVQDEIRQKIVFALKVQLTPEEHQRFQRAPTNNLEAYDYYLRGWEAWTRAYYETQKEANTQARQMFERALALDPAYAAAYAGLGSTYLLEWFLQWNPDRAQSLDRALEMAQKAVALDDSLPGAHQALGAIYTFKRQHDQAVVEAERAIALAPNNANGYETLGWILTYVGRPEEGVGLIEKAMRLNPRYPIFYIRSLGWAYRVAGRYEEALIPLKKFLTLNPNTVPIRLNLAACYAELGRLDEARAEVAEALRLNPTFSLEQARQIYPFKDPADLERFLASWRKAGLK
jgi:TolB-like protein/class 3 adenylate cyclase/cytochrome c-type biogenesis protein CcmH/NrfG